MRLVTSMLVMAMLFVAATQANTYTSEGVVADFFKATEYASMFQQFITKFKRSYASSAFAARLKTFKDNINKLTQSNKDKKPYTLGVTQFADLTPAEFSKQVAGLQVPSSASFVEADAETEVSEAQLADDTTTFRAGFNWLNYVQIRPPRDSKTCGSCWAFTAAATTEVARTIAKQGNEYLSTQQIIDCSITGCRGCNGGWADCAYRTMMDGMYDEKEAPYLNKGSVCAPQKIPSLLGKLKRFETFDSTDKNLLAQIRKGPVWSAVSSSGLQLYKSGILTTMINCTGIVDYSIMLYGYHADGYINYFRASANFGPDWGEAGFFRIQNTNVCNLAKNKSYRPIVV